MSDFIAHWGQAAVRVSILLIVGALLVALCIRSARGRIAPAGRSLLWFVVLSLGLCWFTIPIEQPGWWPAWSQAVAVRESRPTEPRNHGTASVQSEGSSWNLDAADADWPGTFPPGSDGAGPAPTDGELSETALPPDEERIGSTSTDSRSTIAQAAAGRSSAANDGSIVRALFIAWLAAVGSLAALFAFQHASLLRRLRRSARQQSASLAELHRELSRRTGTRSDVRVSDACATPMLVGLFRPRIWLPGWIEELNAESQSAVLAHEMAHIARRDGWTTLIGVVSNALCWFHPLAWLARGRMCAAREQAADAWAVTRAGCSAVGYAKALVDVAERMPSAALMTIPAMSIARSELHHRINGVLEPTSPRWRRLVVVTVIVTLLAGTLVSSGRARDVDKPTSDAATATANSPQSTEIAAIGTADDATAPADSGVDLYGDPLPEGATARLGTVRYRDSTGSGRIEFLADNQTLLSTNSSELIWLDVTTDVVVRRVDFGDVWPTLLAVSRDRSLAAVRTILIPEQGGGSQHGVQVIDTVNGEVRSTMQIPPESRLYQISAADFSPDGSQLVTGASGVVHMWDVATGKETFARAIYNPHGETNRVAVSPDGTWLLVSDSDQVYRWNYRGDGYVEQIEGIDGAKGVEISPLGDTYLIHSGHHDDEGVLLFDAATNELVHRLLVPEHFYHSEQPAFTPDGQHVVVPCSAGVGDRSGLIEIWNVSTGELERTLPFQMSLRQIAISPDARFMAAFNNSRALVTWDFVAGEPLGQDYLGHFEQINSFAVSPDAELVASLRDAWREWQIGTAYKGYYEFWSGSVDDHPEVDLSNIDIETGAHVSHRARGFVCKDGYLYRVSWYPERESPIRTDTSDLPEPPGGGQVGSFLDMDFDEATNGALWIRSYKMVENEHTLVSASVIPEEQLHEGILPRPGVMGMGAAPLPTLPVPATIAFPHEYPAFEPAEYEVVRLDENRVRLQAQREMNDDHASRYTYAVDWWLAPEIPVIERAYHRTERRRNGEDEVHEEETRFADFRICDGLRVPARITCLSRGGAVNANGEPVRSVHVRHWVCEDLGDEAPLEADFAIPIDAADAIIHTRNPKRFREQGRISILEITTDDLLQIGDEINEDAAPPR